MPILASDTARTIDVVADLVSSCSIESGFVLLLQPTSPLRTHADLSGMIDLMTRQGARSAVSVVRHDEPRPEKLLRLTDKIVEPYLDQVFEGPRQALPQPFALNGAFYLVDRDVLLAENSFLPAGTVGFEMPRERSANLDTLMDWQVLQAMLAAGIWHADRY